MEDGEQPGGSRSGLLSRRRRRLPAGRGARPACAAGREGGREGGGWRRHPSPLSLAPHRGVLALGAAEEPCRGTATRKSPPYPAPAGSVPRTVPLGRSPAPAPPRSIPCSRLFSPPRRPTWFSPGQALGISPVPFEEPRFRLASSLPPPLRTARSRLGPPAGAAAAPAAPAPQVPAARARGVNGAGPAVGGARREQRERQRRGQRREGRQREEGCREGAADAAVRWHHSARRRRRSAARRGEEPPRRRGGEEEEEEEERGGRKEKEAAAAVRLRATVRTQNRLCRSRFVLRSGPAETRLPSSLLAAARPWAAGGVGAARVRSAPVTEGRGGGEWAWGLKWRREL